MSIIGKFKVSIYFLRLSASKICCYQFKVMRCWYSLVSSRSAVLSQSSISFSASCSVSYANTLARNLLFTSILQFYNSIESTIFFNASADSFNFNASSPFKFSGMSDSTPFAPTIAGILSETPSIS